MTAVARSVRDRPLKSFIQPGMHLMGGNEPHRNLRKMLYLGFSKRLEFASFNW
jgi:hypothetical protein